MDALYSRPGIAGNAELRMISSAALRNPALVALAQVPPGQPRENYGKSPILIGGDNGKEAVAGSKIAS
jgi:hypothetical protein